jgi:hypothetical protein
MSNDGTTAIECVVEQTIRGAEASLDMFRLGSAQISYQKGSLTATIEPVEKEIPVLKNKGKQTIIRSD